MLHSPLQQRLFDVGALGLTALGVVLSLTTRAPGAELESPAWWWVDLAGGVVALALVAVRRQAPVTVAVGVWAVGLLATSAWIAGCVVTFGLALRRPWPVAVGLGAGSLSSLVITGLVRPLNSDRVVEWSEAGWVVLVTALLIASGVAVRARGQLMESLVERAERAEREAALRAEAARTAERTRIAREMHDVLAHRLSMVSLHAGALAHRRTASPEEIRDALEVVRAGARDALVDLRAILGVLRDPDADPAAPDEVDTAAMAPQPTLADLDRLVDGVRAAGTPVTLHNGLDVAAVPDECGRTLYRITQETLTNAARHAPGHPVDVVLRDAGGGEIELDVSNPLPPSGTPGPPGNGLLGITERAELAGGRVLARGADGAERFRVAVRVPQRAEAREIA